MTIQIAESHSFIELIIPWIIDLIHSNYLNVRDACISLLVKFSEQGKTPDLSGLTLLMTTIAEFRHSIGLALPVISDLLKDTNRIIYEAGAAALSRLFKQGNLSVCMTQK
jgi:hypothetical protein